MRAPRCNVLVIGTKTEPTRRCGAIAVWRWLGPRGEMWSERCNEHGAHFVVYVPIWQRQKPCSPDGHSSFELIERQLPLGEPA